MKKFLKIGAAAVVAAICGAFACGCDGSISIEKPEIQVYGNVICWNEVDGVDSYVVNAGEEQREVFSNYYVFNDLAVSTQVSVRSKVGEKTSKKSNTVSVMKTKGFTQEETYELTLADNKNYDILPTQNYVKISGTASNSQVIIQNRARDLVVELTDVTMSASQGNNCISTGDGKYETEDSSFTVVFIINGNNSINGSTYTATPSKQPENSGKYGVRGGNGGHGIVLPNIVLTGDGTLSVCGGNGGKGGDGADSSGISTSSNGSGGNGGNGGSGFLCTNLVMAMGVDGVVKPYAGNGGSGGKAGVNGSIMSGPWVSIAQSRKDGEAGNKGSAYAGNLIRLSGTFN